MPDRPHFSRPMTRPYDVQARTGYSVSTYREGQWDRGALYRGQTPYLSLAPFWPMFDPTDPSQWNDPPWG